MPPVALSLIIPVHNERDNLKQLHQELIAALKPYGREMEMIFVDDGSSDGSLRQLECLREKDPRVRVISLGRHLGQSAALFAGIAASRAEVLASLDADLQYDANDLMRVLKALDDADMVCAWRENRSDTPAKHISSWFANALRRKILKDDIRDAGCTLRAWKKNALDGIVPFNGFHRFLAVMVQRNGKKIQQIPVGHRRRISGKSHYGIWRRGLAGLVDTLGMLWLFKRSLNSPRRRSSPFP